MMTTTRIKTYSEMLRFPTFRERYDYLRIGGRVGEDTFGFDRYLNQKFYKSRLWTDARDFVIVRDSGCDLGVPEYSIAGKIIVHHINPITITNIIAGCAEVFDPEFLISVSVDTHLAIHYSDSNLLPRDPIRRYPNDTLLWVR